MPSWAWVLGGLLVGGLVGIFIAVMLSFISSVSGLALLPLGIGGAYYGAIWGAKAARCE